MATAVPILVMLIAGSAIALQSLFAGTFGQRIGVMESAFIVHLGGLVLAGAIVLFMRGGNMTSLTVLKSVPWYVYTAGFMGVLIVGAYSYGVPKLGLAASITLAILVQLVLSAILDHFGVLGTVQKSFDIYRGLGIGALLLGTWLILR